MDYKVIERNNVKVLNLEFETFDYYSNNPKLFNELLKIDEKILSLIKKISNGKIYVLASMRFSKESNSKYGLWSYHSLPNENPTEDFKYKVDFNKTLGEYKIIGENYINYIGVAEISIDFYLQNYLFFNRNNGTVIFICEEKYVNNIIINITNDFQIKLDEYRIIDVDNLTKIAANKSIVVTTKDDEEFKRLELFFENDVKLIDKIKDIISTK